MDDVKSSWPLHPGLHTCYNGRYNGSQQSLVIVGQHTTVNTFPGLVHTARQAMEGGSAQSRDADPQGGPAPKARPLTGAKS